MLPAIPSVTNATETPAYAASGSIDTRRENGARPIMSTPRPIGIRANEFFVFTRKGMRMTKSRSVRDDGDVEEPQCLRCLRGVESQEGQRDDEQLKEHDAAFVPEKADKHEDQAASEEETDCHTHLNQE